MMVLTITTQKCSVNHLDFHGMMPQLFKRTEATLLVAKAISTWTMLPAKVMKLIFPNASIQAVITALTVKTSVSFALDHMVKILLMKLLMKLQMKQQMKVKLILQVITLQKVTLAEMTLLQNQ